MYFIHNLTCFYGHSSLAKVSIAIDWQSEIQAKTCKHTHTNTTTKLSYTKYEDNNSNERERKPNLTEIISAEENKTTIDGYGYHLGDRIRESPNVMIVFSLCAENTKERMSNIVVALPVTCVCSFGN